MHGGCGHVEELGCFLDGQASEDAQLGDFGLAVVQSREAVEDLIHLAEDDNGNSGGFREIGQADERVSATAFAGVASFIMGAEDAAHHLGGNSENVGTVGEVDAVLADEPEVGFVDKGGGLKCVLAAFIAHVRSGEAMQFAVQLRQYSIERDS